MVLEKREKRKKQLFIGIPALVVVLGVVITLLALLVFGGGMSPEEFREHVAEDNNNVVLALKKIDQEWLWADVSEEPSNECYPIVRDCTQEAIVAVEGAKSALALIEPPEESCELHESLSQYYQDVEAYLEKAKAVFVYLSDWHMITEEANTYVYAVEQVEANPDASPAEFISWMDKDIAALNGFLQRANALQAPEDCKAFAQEYAAMLQEELSILERIKKALINRDWVAYDVAVYDLEDCYNGIEARIADSLQGFMAFYEDFIDLIERGEALREEIKTGVPPRESEIVSVYST